MVFIAMSLTLTVFMASMYKVWSSPESFKPNNFQLLNIIKKPLNVSPRLEYYKFAVTNMLNSPIWGYGPGNFYFPKANYYHATTSTIFTHNHLLQKIYELGLPGGLIYFGLLLWLFMNAIKNTSRDSHGRLLLLGAFISFLQAMMDFGWEIPIVYYLNLLIVFHFQPDNKSHFPTDNLHRSLFVLLMVWTVVSGISNKSTSEKFSKLITIKAKSDLLSSPLVKQWVVLDRGNGKMYLSLSGKEFIAGNYKTSLELAFKSINSPIYSDVVSSKYLVRFLAEPVISQLDSQSIFRILDYISTKSTPHDFYWVKPEEDKKTIFKAVNLLLIGKPNKDLGDKNLAKLYYWKFTGSVTDVKSINKAVDLDPANQEYKNLKEIVLMANGGSDLKVTLDRIKESQGKITKGTVYVSLTDIAYSKMADKLEIEGDVINELQIRTERLNETHYRQAYISYISRLVKLKKQEEAEKILQECKIRYANCEN